LGKNRIKARADKDIRILQSPRRRRLAYLGAWLVFLVVVAFTTILISRVFFFQPYHFELGKVIGQTIRAPFPFEVEDREVYNKKVEEVLKKTPQCYEYDSEVEDRIAEAITGVRDEVIATSQAGPTSMRTLQKNLKKKYGISLTDNATTTLLSIGNDQQFYHYLRSLIHDIMTNRGLIDDKYTFETFEKQGRVKMLYKHQSPPANFVAVRLVEYPEELVTVINLSLNNFFSGVPTSQLYAARDLALRVIEPNIVYRPDLTQEERAKLVGQVEKVRHAYARGEVIINAMERANTLQDSALNRLSERLRAANLMQLLANFLFLLIVCGFVAFFVHKFNVNMGFTAQNIILISLPVFLPLTIGRLVVQVLGKEDIVAGYAFPAGIIGILGIMLLDARIAFLLVSWGALLFGLMVDMNFKITLLAFIGGVTSVCSLYNVRERKEMLMAGFRIALVNFISVLILEYMDDPTGEFQTYAMRAVWGLGNGIACGIIAFPALVFFEVFFGVVTDVRLLELTGIRQPLLSEMEESASGTYQHSLNVSKLAEPAAIAVGANYLLVRAGAYYHDIGKTVKPKYYSENQTTPEDKKIYQNITPSMSVLIIKKHIKDGMELAQKWGLPKRVFDFIPQHHGTGLIRYFYNQALNRYSEGKSNDPVRKEDFRYPGPKPQSIEAAIVMLADIVEAASTSKLMEAYLSEDDIRRIVHEAVLNQFNDEQFDECSMTLRDLHLIEESFVKTLVSRYHHRVQYPRAAKEAERDERMLEQESPNVSMG
jgi:hypothetical protein